jgi:glutamate racemase
MTLVGSARLASLAETALAGGKVDDDDIRREIAPCFVERGAARTDTVVLACTHYPLLLDRLTALAPWPVDWVDPASAIARRVVEMLPDQEPGKGGSAPSRRAVFTSGETPPVPVREALAAFGLALAGAREPNGRGI